MQHLLMILSAPVRVLKDGRLRLDTKFIQGLAIHRAMWNGPIRCLLWENPGDIPFGTDVDPATLSVDLVVLARDEVLTPAHFDGAEVVLAGADDFRTHTAVNLTSAPVVYILEYTLKTRLDILRLERGRSVIAKAKSAIWLLRQEFRMRKALRKASGLQFNGFPSHVAYGKMSDNVMIYLDGRMGHGMFPENVKNPRGHNLPLRLVNFGRLETLKGAHDFVPLARALSDAGVNFTFDIFGAGSLEHEIRSGISSAGLENVVRLHGPREFAEDLVPWLRNNADVFVSCHRQDDPSCAYIEAMGCGLPVVGYDNAMLSALIAESRAGWIAPLGSVAGLAAVLRDLNSQSWHDAARNALSYAKSHEAGAEFKLRMDHLRGVAVNSATREAA